MTGVQTCALPIYDYATGHLLNFEGFPEAEAGLAFESGSGLVIAPDGRRLERVAEAEPWRVSLPGRLTRLVGAGGARVVIVIDSAPVQIVSDALVLSRLATGVLYVVKADDTPYPVARQGLKRLRRAVEPFDSWIVSERGVGYALRSPT